MTRVLGNVAVAPARIPYLWAGTLPSLTMKIVSLLLAAMTATTVFAGLPPRVIPLWPEGVPGAKANLGPEKQENGQISNVSEPTLTIYSPAVDRPNGTAVII